MMSAMGQKPTSAPQARCLAYYRLAEIRGQKASRRFSWASRALALCSSELSPPQEVAKGNGLRRVALKPLQLLGRPPTGAVLASCPSPGTPDQRKTPDVWFSGEVIIDPLFEALEPARVRGARVTFEPGARTAWHTHPLGQTLIVTSGVGWAQYWGGPKEEIRPGDVPCSRRRPEYPGISPVKGVVSAYRK